MLGCLAAQCAGSKMPVQISDTPEWFEKDYRYVEKELAGVKRLKSSRGQPGSVFEEIQVEINFFKRYRKDEVEKRTAKIKTYNTTKLANTMYMQGSARKRIYDVNIILRALYQNRLLHNEIPDLPDRFANALFIDIGSAILYQEGAPTVRDIYEDKLILRPGRIAKVLATDINDYSTENTRFIDDYRKSARKLPFPVEQIEMSMTRPYHFEWILKRHSASQNQPLIIRAMNTGPDLFYHKDQLKKHLRSLLAVTMNRDVIYFLRTYILYKPAGLNRFHVLGRLDSSVWYQYYWYTRLNWDTERRLYDAIHEYNKYIRLKDPSRPTGRYGGTD